jgi:hypothetical protein
MSDPEATDKADGSPAAEMCNDSLLDSLEDLPDADPEM